MTIPIKVLRSSDTGAPVLSGTAGALTTILSNCLVDGYNSLSVSSITRSGSTATLTFSSAHGYASDNLTVIRVAGASQTEYNGDFYITGSTSTTVTVTVTGTPATPATGTITSKVAPLDWEKTYTGTNKAAFRSTSLTSSRIFLRVDDNSPNPSPTAQKAVVVGYETMSDIDTGVGMFPSVGQLSTGLYVNKSNVASGTPRVWVLIGDDREFLFFYCPYSAVPTAHQAYRCLHFGDPNSELSSDPYGCAIIADTDFSPGDADSYSFTSTISGFDASGHYFARNFSQTGTSSPFGKIGPPFFGANTIMGGTSNRMPYPSPVGIGAYASPVYGTETGGSGAYVIRCTFGCMYAPLHNQPLGNLAILNKIDSPVNRKLLAMSINTTGECWVDIEGPWR